MTTGATAETSWMGAFSPLAFTEVLKRVAQESRSGELRIVSGNWIKTIGVDAGAVRSATSNMRQDRLGESMLSHESISGSDFKVASEKMAHEGCRFGEALVEMGRLDRKQLQRELAVQIQRIVLSLFRVSEGLYSFEEAEPSDERAAFSLPVPPLLLKGLRRIDDGRILLEAMPPADATVRLATTPLFPIDGHRLPTLERSILHKAREGVTIGSLVRNQGLPRRQALRSCYGLLTLGLLEVAPETEADPAASAAPQPGPSDDSTREMIEGRFEQQDALADEDLLGVPRDASQDELDHAYKQASEEWVRIRSRTQETGLAEKIDAIEFRLAAAYHQLLVERDRSAGGSVVGGEATEDTTSGPREARIVQLVRDAKLHLQVEDCNGAMSLLHELVALEPANASYQVMLGQAMMLHPTLDKGAEEHFMQALELEPDNADVRVALGRYLQRVKQTARAAAEFTRALDIDPEHEDARRYLESTNEPTKMKRFMTKLFG